MKNRKLWARMALAITASAAMMSTGLSVPASAATTTPATLDLRVLLIGEPPTGTVADPTTAAWESALATDGVQYTEVDAAGTAPSQTVTLPPLSSGTTGYFNGVVFADSPLDFASGQLNPLYTYESTFKVNQLDGYAFPSPTLGATEVTAGALDGTTGGLTTAGLADFPELAGPIPFATGTYGYGAAITAGAPYTAIITNSAGNALAGIYQHPATDPQAGVAELTLYFDYNAAQLQWLLLAPGLINWVTQGTHIGQYRNYVEMDIDDTFTPDDAWDATTHEIDYTDTDSLRMNPEDVITSAEWSRANNFRLDQLFNFGSTVADQNGELAYNGATSAIGPDPLLAQFQATDPATGQSYADDFGWISHTYDTPYLDVGCATQDYIEAELNQNSSSIAAAPGATPGTGGLGLTDSTDDTLTYGAEDPQVFVPGNHSGFADLVPGNPATVDEPDLDDATPGTDGGLVAGYYEYAVTDQFTAAPVSATAGESAAFLTGPVSVAANGSVTLTWQAICHAANYNIYRQQCADSTCTSGSGWMLVGNYYTPAEATLPDDSSADASPASTTSVTGAGEQELTFTDTGSTGAECDGSAPGGGTYCVTVGAAPWTAPPITEGAVESAWEQNPYFIPAMEAVGITAVGADASKPYPDPPTDEFGIGTAYTGPEYAAGQTFVDGTAQVVPRHPVNIFYNASTEAQELDEYNTLYSASVGTSTFAGVVNSIVSQMLQFMLTNNPEPSYVHQTNLMGLPPGCTDATWPSNCTVTATTGTPPATADTTGDGLLYSVLDPLLSEYHSYFSAATPYEQLTEGQIASVLANQAAWSPALTGTSPTVTATDTGGVVTLTNSGTSPVSVPISVPTGTTGGASFLESYGGQLSGWVSVAAGSSLTLTEPGAVVPAPPTTTTPPSTPPGSPTTPLTSPSAPSTPTAPSTATTTATPGAHFAPLFVTKPKATATAGKKFSFTVGTSGFPFAQLTHSALPGGLHWTDNANGKATIWGVPLAAAAGAMSVKLTASNALGSAKQVLVIAVQRPPALGASVLPMARAGKRYAVAITALGYPTPLVTVSGLPAGLAFAFSGAGKATLSGVPMPGSEGIHHVKVTVSNPLGKATATYNVVVGQEPAITSKAGFTVEAGQAFSFRLKISGYPHAGVAHSPLPRGLKWANTAGNAPSIAGKFAPDQTGTHHITITAKNPVGTARQVLTIEVTY
ncbi:MAG TPA: hypothetical protein VMF65_15450 [Acidimicrobiales bacterium]|nr:hypothetical protein [Acidimicrobiales bacterium]